MTGSPAVDYPADWGPVIVAVAATAPISEHASVFAGHPRTGAHRPMSPAVPNDPASAETPLPAGGGVAAAASGGLGSAAPPVAPAFTLLVLALATILLARFSFDLASCRSALLWSRLDRPG